MVNGLMTDKKTQSLRNQRALRETTRHAVLDIGMRRHIDNAWDETDWATERRRLAVRRCKMMDMKTTDQLARHEIAVHEITRHASNVLVVWIDWVNL